MTQAPFSPDALHVVAIVGDAATAELIRATLAGSGDELSIAVDLAEGLARAASDAPDAVLVDVALGKNAGLAVVHHARAVAPTAAVYAMVAASSLALGAQAIALGSTGVLMLPLSGDELLTALAEVRTRRAERRLRFELEREAELARRDATTMTGLVAVAEANSRREAATRLLPLMVDAARTSEGLLYIPAGEGSRQLMRVASIGSLDTAPAFCEELEILEFSAARGLEVLRLSLRQEQSGLALLGPSGGPPVARGLLDLLASQGAAALALISERERSHRSAMKDPQSSAYTFAYFVDVAGREIDKARRHGRRFALATIALSEDSPRRVSESTNAATELVERVLSVVRDTDVLARVDEGEFYLLMPETGGVGAHICRRRVMRELLRGDGLRRPEREGVDFMVGVATYPHDGRDLSQLLRVAKHRADASQHSVVWNPDIARAPLARLYEEIARVSEGSADQGGLWRLALPSVDLLGLAASAVTEAARGGNMRVVATQRPGVSVGAAVRGALDRDGDRDSETGRVDVVDLAQQEGCGGLEALAVIAQHGAYALLGRMDGTMVYAAHASDPLLVDLLIDRIGEATGSRLGD